MFPFLFAHLKSDRNSSPPLKFTSTTQHGSARVRVHTDAGCRAVFTVVGPMELASLWSPALAVTHLCANEFLRVNSPDDFIH